MTASNSSLVAVIEAARAGGDPSVLASRIPYAGLLGIDVRLVDGELLGVMPYKPDLIGNSALPALHGGTLGALLESTAIFHILWHAESIVLPKTINITIDYLRSGKPVDTQARCEITRLGRRVANVRAEAWQDDRARPIAAAHAHFLVEPAPA